MAGWTLVDTHPNQGRTFQRFLDNYELSFLWDGLLNGTADNLQHLELRLKNGSRDAQLFSEANIVRAWLSTKRRYPLAGAIVRGADNAPLRVVAGSSAGNGTGLTSTPCFVIQEYDLAVLRPQEVVFGKVASAEDAQRRGAAILDGPRPLSDELLAQLYVLRETNPKRSDVLHLMILTAHTVTDGIANTTFVRCLLDTLARGEGAEPAQIPLEERLAMAVPSMDLEPLHLRSLNPVIRRWRRVVGAVIFQLKMAKRQGGHTLPCHFTRSTLHTAARSGLVSTSLTREQTVSVIDNCRLHGLTLGNAYFALGQVAMTRVLYRRYLRGDISEEEWDYRKKQPHLIGGPLNLRSYLDETWFRQGGGGEFMLSVSTFFYQLPFMTLGETTKRHQILSNGAPPFSDLLAFDRFLHRAGLVKKQAIAFFNHPLFLEVVRAFGQARIEDIRRNALQWMERIENTDGHDTDGTSDEVLAVPDMSGILAHGGSSMGSMDVTPIVYPLPPTHPLSPCSSVSHPAKAGYIIPSQSLPPASENATTPTIVVENARTRLHTRPAELYLGAASSRGQLHMLVFYDANVFEEGIVREWLDEVREAVLWYLGQTHRSRHARQGDGDDGCIKNGQRVQVKL